jgi:hypothetical protein
MTETPAPDIPPEAPDIEDHAIEMVPPLDPPDPFERDEPSTAAEEEIGHRLADELDQMAVPEDRPMAARDLIHEMVQAGAEGEITADLLYEELPPEEFTEADYAAYDAESGEPRAASCE